MYKFTEKLEKMEPYDPIQGEYEIRLDANESFIKTDYESIIQGLKSVDLNRYPDPYAKKLIQTYSDLYGIDKDSVTAGNGSDELISIITACFLQKKDKVLCFSPDFSMYAFYSALYELEVIVAPKRNDLTIDVDGTIDKINSENIKAVLFSNPCNPTSLGLKKDDVIRLIRSVDALVVLDEAYMDFWDERESLLKETDEYNNLIVLRTCSKALGMAALRLGFAVSNRKITEKLRAVKSPYNVNTLTQSVAEYLLGDKKAAAERIELCKASKTELYNGLNALNAPYFEEIYPSVTNFVFIKTSQAKEIFDFLLKKSIAVRCMGNYLRITGGSHEENRAVLDALKEFK
ncbi:MAG: histidinol-phosphate aminotransferase family protein [Oscillospiraceae bacterium]|nr:histidinol-phosphate aminotransferase family protein [Oscillospiraceae bacterium]